ncbi:flavin reductase family protein [Nocardioides sp. W7]|uniref:flavin reductase family protein n=1 Tax=Nocardioides sp. W7 TaxID=2931390 RepID=UPI001FD17B8F|nr:flavin reductase family protein [Nocardioides sp. W7]
MTLMTTDTDPATLRAAYASFPTGVTAVCAELEGELVGMAASSFTAVSLDPPLVSVCVMHGSRTWQRLQEATRLGVSVLAADQGAACRALGAKEGDRFVGVDTAVTPEGAVLVRGAGVWLDCEVQGHLPAGDHEIVLLRVLGLDVDTLREPLVHLAGGFRDLTPRAPRRVETLTAVAAAAAREGALS